MNNEHPIQTLLAQAIASACLISSSGLALSEPSQTPLLQRSESGPKPNLMFSLDDSGSMTHQYVPEGKFTVNGTQLTFPSDARIYMHPKEIAKNIWSLDRLGFDTRFVTAVSNGKPSLSDAERIYQYQMRSPQINKLYYNPATPYTPWTGICSSGTDTVPRCSVGDNYTFTPATYSAAQLDPMALDKETADIRFNDATHIKVIGTTVDLSLNTDTVSAAWSNTRYNNKTDEASKISTTSEKPFNPALIYLLNDNSNPTKVGNFREVNLNDGAADVTYEKAYAQRTDCTLTPSGTQTRCSITAEQQNFANWFVFYRSRLMTAQGGIPAALNEFDRDFRFGWGTLRPGVLFNVKDPTTPSDPDITKLARSTLLSSNTDPLVGQYDIDGAKSATVQYGVRDWDANSKRLFTQWLRAIPTFGGTPTRQAVDSVGTYFTRQSPWLADPSATTGTELTCRRAYHMVMTDGYYTDLTATDATSTANVNTDGAKGADDKYLYDTPFHDDASGTLSDYVMKYWATPLRSETGEVTPIVVTQATEGLTADEVKLLADTKGDPQTFQHLNHVFMGFGVTSPKLPETALTNPAAYDAALLKMINCEPKIGNTKIGDC